MRNVRDSQAGVQGGVDRGNSHYTFDFAQNVTAAPCQTNGTFVFLNIKEGIPIFNITYYM